MIELLKQPDKLSHCKWCFGISFVAFLALGPICAIAITMGIGIVKEVVYDYLLKKGTPERGDIYADMIGTVGGIVSGEVIKYIFL